MKGLLADVMLEEQARDDDFWIGSFGFSGLQPGEGEEKRFKVNEREMESLMGWRNKWRNE